jgi:hypothetical protein
MAVEWFVQHGGKLYGPLTGVALKKLASEGKISAATSVRKGTDGAWVPASRVQGLFAAAPAAAPSPAPPSAPPVEPPAPPPRAKPMLQPVARRAPLPKAVPAPSHGAMAPKIVGGLAMILGAVAFSTCWLPVMGGAIGWTGIVAGSLGLLVGGIGFALAAIRHGSGLMLNISGAASSAVGLVLSVVLGVVFGLFASKPVPAPAVVVAPIAPVQQPQPEPEPESPPEPRWFDAGEPIDQGAIHAELASMGIEQIRLENADLSTMKKGKPQPMLKIRVKVTNTSADRIIEFAGWVGGGDMIAQGVTQLLSGSELGKAVQAAAPVASLADNIGNPYKQVPGVSVFGTQLPAGQDLALRPAQSREAELVFPPPLESIEYLRLELSPAAYGGSEPLRWQIPKALIKGLGGPATP